MRYGSAGRCRPVGGQRRAKPGSHLGDRREGGPEQTGEIQAEQLPIGQAPGPNQSGAIATMPTSTAYS